MEFSYQDKGNYFRGLLILVGKDNIINENERIKVIELGKKLSFDPKFCLDSLNDFLENEFIDLSPPKFSSQKIAEKFLDDAFDLAIVDNEMLNEELEWLKSVALENNLEDKWFDKNLQNATNKLKPRKHYTSI
jgi:hypothetical protein